MKYLKVEDDRLKTPVIQYSLEDLTITVIGAIHIGEEDYYRKIQILLDELPEGFYEGINPARNENNIVPEKQSYVDGVKNLSRAYETFSRYLGVVTQKEILTYPEGWENSDMTLDDFVNAVSVRTLKKLSQIEEEVNKLNVSYHLNPLEFQNLLKKVIKFSFKHPYLISFLSFFGQGGSLMNDNVILKQRNQLLFNHLQDKLAGEDQEELGIIYGAKHLIGINKFLQKKGFKREGELWLSAINF